jgi:hypothetical protein
MRDILCRTLTPIDPFIQHVFGTNATYTVEEGEKVKKSRLQLRMNPKHQSIYIDGIQGKNRRRFALSHHGLKPRGYGLIIPWISLTIFNPQP